MLSRALTLVAAILIAYPVAAVAQAQNLEAGKSPSQIFSGTCTACHKSPRGLLKTVSPSSLSGFLRQHYTTGKEMAQTLSGFLMSNGAGTPDSRVGRSARPETGRNLRPDAPIGSALSDVDHKPPQAATAAKPHGKPSPHQRPIEVGAPNHQPILTGDAKSKPVQKKGELPKSEPPAIGSSAPESAAAVVASPEPTPQPMSEQAISAAVPIPQPVDLPPPTALDIRPEPPADALRETAAEPSKRLPAASSPARAGPPVPPISQ